MNIGDFVLAVLALAVIVAYLVVQVLGRRDRRRLSTRLRKEYDA